MIAIGYPLGIGTTVTHGIVSAVDRRNLEGTRIGFCARHSNRCSHQKGNSGGALANVKGELVGINTAIASETGGNIGIGFSIPINSAREIIKNIISNGRTVAAGPEIPFLGIASTPLDPGFAK